MGLDTYLNVRVPFIAYILETGVTIFKHKYCIISKQLPYFHLRMNEDHSHIWLIFV